MIDTFKATHCGQTFTGAAGAKALELHMKAEHKRKPYVPGGRLRYADERPFGYVAPGWKNGEIEKPHPWKAPRPARGGLEKVIADMSAGKYDVHVLDGEATKLEQRRIMRHITAEHDEIAS